jgi:hypothetical protein
MLPRELKVASLNVQANAAYALPLLYIQHYAFVHNAAVVGEGEGVY